MRSLRLNLLPALLCFVFGAACSDTAEDEVTTGEEMPEISVEAPIQVDGKSDVTDGSTLTTEQRAAMYRMKDRYPEQRALKAMGVLGEGAYGYVTVPPAAEAKVAEDAELKARIEEFSKVENADRDLYYTHETDKYRVEVERQVEAQMPTLRKQVTDDLCAQLPEGRVCESIAEEVIEAALGEAIDVALDAAMAEVRTKVERLHARFWQRKTTKAGEWIEGPRNGEMIWIKKPAGR